jgi:hypothetical protein
VSVPVLRVREARRRQRLRGEQTGPGEVVYLVTPVRRNAEGWLGCPRCSQVLVEETDGIFCGGCGVSWWRA